ncbi:hypothetical protein [uncultured Aquimarina sp.]|uniref:hypothetical protein n=1 Tax=uncultured Aquimarina sp. TaxID=575652 RepID=UPI002639789B|nr:hypothetical protein [uncultured Aquimarina sp.]
MTEFNPPISIRDTEELIAIVNSGKGHWQKEAIDQARNELIKRNVSQDEQEKVVPNWNKLDEEYFQELGETFEENQDKSYSILKKVSIFVFAPLIIFNSLAEDTGLLSLFKENSKLRFKQRLILLLTGTMFWLIVGVWSIDNSEEERLKLTPEEEIEFLEWKKKHRYE